MSVISLHAVRTFKGLPEHVRRRIRDDWYRVMECAERERRERNGDGLVDGTVPFTLHKLKIDERPVDEYRAYHYMLFNFFLFGEDAKVKSAEHRKRERGGCNG